ncbi:putative nucleic acid-binding Zn-ribbon protein [Anaerosolibacter carboniphilus]|uniref:Putative nucleic acid-binding Zn-ribbon protein n=1 Tax=Anaerosolibacter carboniphilus TaxID=1417629 RepID=A0A841L972_9FIRM|nr:hypothetical protein [Anaerosolibacter carboniphilus]MBB6218795.1 putative nucleic acid-binding Zn-ribbon protein [Anaerosolibacter carboniphilus]
MAKEMDLEEKIVRRNKIPILPFDQEWKENFGIHQTKTMEEISKEIMEKVNEEKQGEHQIQRFRKKKKQLMNKILELSNEANTSNNDQALVQLESAKDEILRINDQLDELQYQQEILPKEIEKLNFDLLKETIALAYEDIKEGSERSKTVMEEILELRKQLTEKWDEKISLENRVNSLYSYLHNTLGHEETDKLDRMFL